MKRILFIDRDGTLVKEAPPTYQLDRFEKVTFYPGVFRYLNRIADGIGVGKGTIANPFMP